WQTAELPPDRLISSKMMLASVIPSPAPPYSSGIKAARYPLPVRASTNSFGYFSCLSTSCQYVSGKSWQSLRTSSRIDCRASCTDDSMPCPPNVGDVVFGPLNYNVARGLKHATTG